MFILMWKSRYVPNKLLKGNTSDQDAFGQITEVAAKAANDMELEAKANKNNANLRIIEIEFLEAIK